MQRLALRPSKRLILLYSLLYGLSLVLILAYAKSWPWFISFIVIISISYAGTLSIYPLWALKAMIWLPAGKIDLQFKRDVQSYDQITVLHQGPQLIILQCKNAHQQRYLLCFADAFAAEDFALLQRLLKSKEW